MSKRSADDGFTLIEALIALSVISLAAVALIAASEATLQRVYQVELRRAASWVADAELTKIELGGQAISESNNELYGMRFSVRANTTAVPGSNLEKITLEIYAENEPSGASNILARQVGFRSSNTVGP